VFVLIVTKYRFPIVKAKRWIAKLYIFVITYLIWYNYLQAFFDIIYDKKEGVHFPLRSTGLSITITCKTTFAYMLQHMAQRGIEIEEAPEIVEQVNGLGLQEEDSPQEEPTDQ
jgi:hypothetical protein